jgi:hypothetical protein
MTHLRLYEEIPIKDKILCLPRDIQANLYIRCFRTFWRDYVPLTAQVPTWVHRANKIQKELHDAQLQNIHFLHLPCNTLESAKRYIPGCQCAYCKPYGILREDLSEDLHWTTLMVTLNQMYHESVPYHENFQMFIPDNLEIPLTHNTNLNLPGIREYTEFDHLYGTQFESSVARDLRDQVPLHFSEPVLLAEIPTNGSEDD